MSLERWKAEKTLKKAKKQAMKQLMKEGASHGLAKTLVGKAMQRLGENNESDTPE